MGGRSGRAAVIVAAATDPRHRLRPPTVPGVAATKLKDKTSEGPRASDLIWVFLNGYYNMTSRKNEQKIWLNRRHFVKSMGAAVAVSAIGCDEKAETDGPGKADGGSAGVGTGADKAVAQVSKLESFRKEHRLRFSMSELSHFADRSRDGILAIAFGGVASRKYVNGGWRSGWDTTPREHGGESCFEGDSKSVRVFFKHEKGGFDRIVVRMKAVKKSNKVTFYVNDNAIKTVDIDGGWKDYIVEVPKDATRAGENQLMMRLKHDTKVDGRKQTAHFASVHILPAGAEKKDAPKGPRRQALTFGDLTLESLVAATPQSYTFRLEIPSESPKLALAYGAKVAGATFTVTARTDKGSAPKTLLNKTVSEASKWSEELVDLAPLAGAVAEITLTVGGSWEGGQLAAFGQPEIFSKEVSDGIAKAKAPEKHAKNILVYLIDTLRYDKFDFYNKKTSCKTPNISAFAKDATIFDAAYDNENWTKPSTASILTGLYPDTHKAKEDTSKLPVGAKMISQHFKSNSFKTGSFLANGYVSDAFGFKKGWDYYVNYIREKKNTNADRVVKDALKWIGENKDDRFFAYVHTIDPHVPYSPPQKWREMYWKREYDGPIKPQSTGQQLADIKTKKLEVNNQDKRYLEALYDGETSFNDHAFGELVKGLKDAGVYEDTAIVIISDHGEEFWDHGSVGHGHSLYEEMVRSPLIVRYPNKAPVGRRLDHVVTMVDLAPTLFELSGIEGHEALEGKSFVDTFDGIGDPHPRIGVSDFLYRKKSVRVGPYKWVTIGRGGQLFNVVEDRGEKKDLIKKSPIARAFVRSNFGLFKGAGKKSEWWTSSDKAGPALNLKADANAEVDEETLKMLEAMGYVDGAKGEDNAKSDKEKMEKEDN
jgi:hypothetical protein